MENTTLPRNKASHCKWGHEFTEENTRMHNGARRCRTCHRLESTKYNRKNVQKRRVGKLKIKYGISAKDFEEMLHRQGNVCAICKESSNKVLNVDHDHRNGKVRGPLCSTCNTGLGFFKDNKEGLLAALEYLNMAQLV